MFLYIVKFTVCW